MIPLHLKSIAAYEFLRFADERLSGPFPEILHPR